MLARSTLFETHLNPYWCAILDRLSLTGGGNPSRRPSAVSLKRSVEVNVANHTAAAAAAVPTRRKSITQSNASDASEKSLRHILVGGAVRPSAITPLVLTVPEELGGGGRYNPTVTPANGRRNSAQFVTAAEAAVIVPKKSFSTVTTNATATVPAKTPKSKRRRPSAGGGSPQR